MTWLNDVSSMLMGTEGQQEAPVPAKQQLHPESSITVIASGSRCARGPQALRWSMMGPRRVTLLTHSSRQMLNGLELFPSCCPAAARPAHPPTPTVMGPPRRRTMTA
jgi:hypothetical protein